MERALRAVAVGRRNYLFAGSDAGGERAATYYGLLDEVHYDPMVFPALHLVQLSLVYVNTLMIQQVLAESAWQNRLNANDLRGITPLIYAHVNPYGSFQLDLNSRLPIDPPRFGPQSVATQLLLSYDQQTG